MISTGCVVDVSINTCGKNVLRSKIVQLYYHFMKFDGESLIDTVVDRETLRVYLVHSLYVAITKHFTR